MKSHHDTRSTAPQIMTLKPLYAAPPNSQRYLLAVLYPFFRQVSEEKLHIVLKQLSQLMTKDAGRNTSPVFVGDENVFMAWDKNAFTHQQIIRNVFDWVRSMSHLPDLMCDLDTTDIDNADVPLSDVKAIKKVSGNFFTTNLRGIRISRQFVSDWIESGGRALDMGDAPYIPKAGDETVAPEMAIRQDENELYLERYRIPNLEDGEGFVKTQYRSFYTALENIARTLPGHYETRAQKIADLAFNFRQRIGWGLAPSLIERVKKMPHETYEQKKELAKWVNAELRPLGLALMCPKTKKPSLLQAYQGDHPEIGRFRFDYIDSDGRRRQPFSSAELPQLIVIPDDLSRAAYGSRSQRGRS